MRKARKRPATSPDDSDIFSDQDFDLDDFIDAMEHESTQRGHRRKHQRAGWQRIDDHREAKWLRDQLQDWEDWES